MSQEAPEVKAPTGQQSLPIVLALAITNSMACATAYFPKIQDDTVEQPLSAGWSMVLNFLGVGVALKWTAVAQKLGYRYTLVLSSLLLALSTSFSSLEGWIALHFVNGFVGSAPLYLAPEMIASLYDGLLGTNSSMHTFAIIGGSALGAIIGALTSPLVLTASSVVIAGLLFVAVKPVPALTLVEPSKEITRSNMRDMLALAGAVEGFLWGAFGFLTLVMYFPQSPINAPIYVWEPFVGLLVGSVLGAFSLAGPLRYRSDEKRDPDRLEIVRYTSIAASIVSEASVHVLLMTVYDVIDIRDFRETSQGFTYIVGAAAALWGYFFMNHFGTILSIDVDLYTVFPSSLCSIITAVRFITSGIVIALGYTFFTIAPGICLGVGALLLFIPYFSSSIMRVHLGATYISRDRKADQATEAENLRQEIDDLRAEIKRLKS